MTTATYTLNEVSKHRGRESCWIVINGKVYDVTKYLDQHPGGDQEILNEAGTDSTKAFVEVGHSSDAKEILETLLIGSLHPDDIIALARKDCSIPWAKLMWVAIVTSRNSISNHQSFTCCRITAVAAVPIAVTAVAAFILFNRK